MSGLLSILSAIGRHGSPLLILAGITGLAMPSLAEVARSMLGPAALLLAFGAFLSTGFAAQRAEMARRDALLLVGWATLGVPLLGFALLVLLEPSPEVGLGIVLLAIAPPVGSAAAMAALLGLDVTLALVTSMAATLLAPLVVPPLAALLAGAELSLSAPTLALRLGAIVLGGAAAAAVARHLAGHHRPRLREVGVGACVLGLVVIMLSVMHGMRDMLAADASAVGRMLLLVAAVVLVLQMAGAAVFSFMGRQRALTAGLVSGCRNVALIWAAAAPAVAGRADAELFLACSSITVMLLPILLRSGVRLRLVLPRFARA
ncbi:MAG TPA: hypothetical protein VE033_16080 [Acetobacteraceae bacterium]|nr:hypothetical protein [Acetobacteraceae bacterium]